MIDLKLTSIDPLIMVQIRLPLYLILFVDRNKLMLLENVLELFLQNRAKRMFEINDRSFLIIHDTFVYNSYKLLRRRMKRKEISNDYSDHVEV